MSQTVEKRILNEGQRLIGLQITGIRYMTPEESAELAIGNRAVVLVLSDGTELYPMVDDEENDAGVLIARSRDGRETHFSQLERRERTPWPGPPMDERTAARMKREASLASLTTAFYIELKYKNVREPDRFDWADAREGPFPSAEEAIRFAKSEFGVPWRVIDEHYEENHMEYDSGNEDRPPADPPACPACKTSNCEPGGGNWWCMDCGMEF